MAKSEKKEQEGLSEMEFASILDSKAKQIMREDLMEERYLNRKSKSNKMGKKTPKLIPVEISAKDEVLASIRLKGGHILEIASTLL